MNGKSIKVLAIVSVMVFAGCAILLDDASEHDCSAISADSANDTDKTKTGHASGDGISVNYTDSATVGYGIMAITFADVQEGTLTVTIDGEESAGMPISSSTVQFLVPELSSGDHSIKVFTQNKSWTLKLTIVEPIGVSGVTLDIGSAAIAKGGSKKLTATVLPQDASDKGVSWSSSDPSIAKVDQNGNVTAISEGSIIITVTTHDGGFTAECDVKVDAKVKVTVSLSKSSLTLAAGESDRITATVEPDAASKKGVTWSSSNESVATVSSTGEVTAVSAGTAVIAATSNEGGARASCTVHVGITVEGITLNAESLEMHIGGSKVLKATLTPPGATDDLLWTSSNGNVATVSGDGKVSALNAGEAVITVTTHDGTLSAECTVTVMDEPVPVVNDDLLLIIAGCIAIIIAIAAAVFVKHRGKHQGSP